MLLHVSEETMFCASGLRLCTAGEETMFCVTARI